VNSYRVFDSHCDTATELWRKKESLQTNSCMVSLDQTKELAGYGQFFAFCTTGYAGYTPEQLLYGPWNLMKQQLEHMPNARLCGSMSEYDLAMEQRQTAVFFSLEGAEGILCDPGRLEQLYDMGVRMTTLTWNFNNALAGCAKEDGGGLTAAGKEFVRRAQKLGIIIDVSHISDRAFWDIIDLTERPIVASHSNSRHRCKHFRNLTDEQYLAICETGGYAGINLYSHFLSEDGAADFETVYSHMDHFLQIGGSHVALGGDLDGCDRLPDGFLRVKDYQKLAAFLERKGFSASTIQTIYSDTMEKVVKLCIT